MIVLTIYKVYIKAFSKNNKGEVSFYKDGYTDLRGRFDYASINNENLSSIEKFSLFVMSDELGICFIFFINFSFFHFFIFIGSLIKEAAAPSDLGKMNVDVNLKSNRWNEKAKVRQDFHTNNYLNTQKQMNYNSYC